MERRSAAATGGTAIDLTQRDPTLPKLDERFWSVQSAHVRRYSWTQPISRIWSEQNHRQVTVVGAAELVVAHFLEYRCFGRYLEQPFVLVSPDGSTLVDYIAESLPTHRAVADWTSVECLEVKSSSPSRRDAMRPRRASGYITKLASSESWRPSPAASTASWS